ncbi:MAG TPA: hypothetical protein VIU11_10710 [Nakamurella sp.]
MSAAESAHQAIAGRAGERGTGALDPWAWMVIARRRDAVIGVRSTCTAVAGEWAAAPGCLPNRIRPVPMPSSLRSTRNA